MYVIVCLCCHQRLLDVNNALFTFYPGVKVLGSVCLTAVCKFQNSIYGLKHAHRQGYSKFFWRKWYWKLLSTLISVGYKQSPNDHSIFSFGPRFTVFLVYLDDNVLARDDHSETQLVKSHLDTNFIHNHRFRHVRVKIA
jgi:hypothetical protein